MVAAYPGNPSHPGALTRCKPSCTDQQCGPAKHSRTMTNDCDRSHSAMSRHNYMHKRNRQLYCSSMESQTVLLDPRRYTMVRQDALRWNWMSQAKMRASASLRQFWLTHADALLFQIQSSDSSGCNTRIKVKHQITKLLTKVLTHPDALRWDRMHYGETECLKQRCVHQQASDSSGWLMLMHFIFKFNWHQWLPRLIFIWAPPRTRP